MKKLIIIWTAFGLLFEFWGLLALDKFILVDSYDFSINETTNNQEIIDDVNTVINDKAENISVSYNGKYIAYNLDDSLCVEDTKNGKINKVSSEKIMYYKWLENRNMIAIVEKSESGEVQLSTYNPADASKSFVQKVCDYTKNMKVENMATSVLTNVYYININIGNNQNSAYRIDRNNEIKKINVKAKSLGNIKTIPHEDRLIYEDKANGKIFATSPDKELKFNSDNELSLLGIDKNDVIYVGVVKDDKVLSLIYGKISEDTSKWQRAKLDEPVKASDIFFNDKSEIIINNESKKFMKNIMTKKETKYSGILVQVNDNFVACIDEDRKLKYTKLNAD